MSRAQKSYLAMAMPITFGLSTERKQMVVLLGLLREGYQTTVNRNPVKYKTAAYTDIHFMQNICTTKIKKI